MTAAESLARSEVKVKRLMILIARERFAWHLLQAGQWRRWFVPVAPPIVPWAKTRHALALDRLQLAEARSCAGDVSEARRRLGLP